MDLGDFKSGVEIISRYYADPSGYHLAAEHDQIYLYPTDSPMSEEDVAAVKELGWFQDGGEDDVYDPTTVGLVMSKPTSVIHSCPFCGSDDIRFTCHVGEGRGFHSGEDVWSTCCYVCGATFPNRYSKQLLVDQWNRRPTPKE